MQLKQTQNIKMIFSKYPIYFVLAAMIIIMSVSSDVFLTRTNLVNLLISESGRGILALGAGLVIISTGIDLSVGSIVALSAVISASLVQDPTYASRIWPELGYVPTWLAVMAGLAAGISVGAFNGTLIAFFKVPPFIATLGGMVITTGLALTYTNAYPVPMLRNEFKLIGQAKIGPFPIAIIYFVAIILITWVLLNKTRFGKRIYAIGGNVGAARVAGVNVKLNTMIVYIWSGFLAALVGIFLAARTGSGIATMGSGYELDAIAAAIVGGVSNTGGVGTVGGMVVGVMILGVLNNGLLLIGTSPYLQQIIKGLIIVGAVAFDMRKKVRSI